MSGNSSGPESGQSVHNSTLPAVPNLSGLLSKTRIAAIIPSFVVSDNTGKLDGLALAARIVLDAASEPMVAGSPEPQWQSPLVSGALADVGAAR